MVEETDTEADDGKSPETWNLFLFPNIAAGEDRETVKQQLATALKVDPGKVEGWYHVEAPTLLLKQVNRDVAERYMEAILRCGATCNIQLSSERGGLALVPKSRSMDFFVCPSCGYEEEIPKGTRYEECPKCGQVIAKWEEKLRKEREEEARRRRQIREARNEEDQADDVKRKLESLEELRMREREIMEDLGMKFPGPVLRLFERYPVSFSVVAVGLLIGLSSLTMYYVDRYMAKQHYAHLVAKPPSAQIRSLAPTLAEAVSLRRNGNQGDLADLSDVIEKLRGESGASQQKMIHAAQQMMKGVEADKFVSAADQRRPLGAKSKPGPDGAPAVTVNIASIGGIEGLTGIDRFAPSTLDRIAPLAADHGADHVARVLGETREIVDPANPKKHERAALVDQLDGSRLVDLVSSLQADREWDRFLRANVAVFLKANKTDKAIALANAIYSPVLRIEAKGDVMVHMLEGNKQADIKPLMDNVLQTDEKISNADLAARVMLALGRRLAAAGVHSQPGGAMDEVRSMIRHARDPAEKAVLSARLAVAELDVGQIGKANANFHMAVNMAGRIGDTEKRISAFVRIAERYYDARNPALANRILSEAQLIAATRLEPKARAHAFAWIAMAQSYLGDMPGALESIHNAARGKAVQQLLTRMAASQMTLGRYHQAQATMQHLDNPLDYARLQISLVGDLLHNGKLAQAKYLISLASDQARRISDPAERGMVLAEYGRLSERVGNREDGKLFFEEALGMSNRLHGTRRDLNTGIVALNQARSLMFERSRETLAEVKSSVIRDPIQSEIAACHRAVENLLPKSVRPKKSATN